MLLLVSKKDTLVNNIVFFSELVTVEVEQLLLVFFLQNSLKSLFVISRYQYFHEGAVNPGS